jgi:hypothetical protein
MAGEACLAEKCHHLAGRELARSDQHRLTGRGGFRRTGRGNQPDVLQVNVPHQPVQLRESLVRRLA